MTQTQPGEYGSTTTNSIPLTVPIGGLNDIDFGEDPASIGGTVWTDTNPDGIQEAGEAGVEGVLVRLLNADGAIIATATTDVNGDYLFEDLPSGDYSVKVVPPTGDTLTSPNSGSDETVDSDFAYLTDSVVVSLGPAEDVRDIDAGVVDEEKDLTVKITTDSSTVKKNDKVDFLVTSQNSGNSPVAGGAVVKVTVPSNLSITGVTAAECPTVDPCWKIVIDGPNVTATWTGDLLPGEKPPPFTVHTKVAKVGEIKVLASIKTADGSAEFTMANNDSSVALTAKGSSIPSRLAYTGGATYPIVSLAFFLLLAGAALMASERRRNRTTD